MKRHFFTYLLIFTFSSSCKIRQSELLDAADDIPTDLEQQVGFLNGVRALIPDLFIESTTYRVDMFELLDTQKELWSDLEKMETYKRNIRLKQKLLTINLSLEAGEQTTVQRSIDPAAISAWRNSLLQVLETIEDGKPIESQIIQRLNANASSAQAFNGLVTTLLRLIPMPDQERSEIFRAPNEEKLRFLEGRLSQVPQGFEFSRFPWIKDQTPKGLKAALSASHQAIKEFTLLLELHMLLQDSENTIDNRLDSAKERITDIGELDLDIFVDKTVFKERLKALSSKSSINAKQASAIIDQHVDEISDKTISTQVRYENISLHEVSHDLAMFRGMVTGDCSTEYSAGFSASPFEKTFYILNFSGKPIGTASLTLLKDGDGRQVAYVHTINGKKLTAADVKLAFEGIRQLLPAIEASAMVLPTSAQISSLNNLSASQSVFSELVSTRSKGSASLDYLDADLREEIHKVNDGNYDMPSNNQQGSIIDIGIPMIAASGKAVPNKFNKFKPIPMQKVEYAILALDMIAIGQSDMAEKIAGLGGIDFDRLESLDRIMQNKQSLSINEYKAKVIGFFGEFGLDASRIFETHPYYFELGLLRASDALTPENFRETSKIFSNYLRLRGLPPLGDQWYQNANRVDLGHEESVVKIASKLDPNNGEDLERFLDMNRKLSLPLEVIDGVVTRWQDAKVTGLGGAIVKDLYPANILASLIRISSPSDLNQLNAKGFSPLMLAVINGHEQIFKALLEKGVDINLRGSAGESALVLATRWGREQMFKDLINLGADSSGLDPNTAPASMRSEIEGYLKRGPDTQRGPSSGGDVGGDPCKLLQQRLE